MRTADGFMMYESLIGGHLKVHFLSIVSSPKWLGEPRSVIRKHHFRSPTAQNSIFRSPTARNRMYSVNAESGTWALARSFCPEEREWESAFS